MKTETVEDYILDRLYIIQAMLTTRKLNHGQFLDLMTAIRDAIKALEYHTTETQFRPIKGRKAKGVIA